MNCLICDSPRLIGFQTKIKPIESYHRCSDCHFVIKDPLHYLSSNEEKLRYDRHENKDSEGYRRFLSPALDYIAASGQKEILDYGCGPTAFLSKMLSECAIASDFYDPNYFPEGIRLKKYDLISSTEVWEHFLVPMKDIARIVSLLKPGGEIIIMTSITDEVDFETWYYRRDETHIGFFSKKTFDFIAAKFGMTWKSLNKNCFVFSDPKDS